MGKKLYCYYAKPTWTDGVPGIWAHFEDDRYRDGGVCYTFISAISSRLGSPTREMIELHGG